MELLENHLDFSNRIKAYNLSKNTYINLLLIKKSCILMSFLLKFFSVFWFLFLVLQIEQLHKIYKLCGSPPDSFWKRTKLTHATSFRPQHTYKATLRERCKELSTTGVFLLETLLSMEPEKRGTASSALNSEVKKDFNFLFSYVSAPSLSPF